MNLLPSIVVMGVAGCGKSSLGAALAQSLGRPLVEGDDHHPGANVTKMRAGTPLTDADRAGWLDALGRALQAHESAPLGAGGQAVLTCSALKAAYRERLRAAAPGLAFVHLRLSREQARERVAGRGGHYFNPALVDSQFDTLQPPEGEPRVLALDATLPLPALVLAVQQWLQAGLPARP
ncbi:gluconokinase [Aquabacterium sp. OR-4]|uniref:gluconokinase n=1 Tax=Aquabacterium sp. OR-4 TaxID=2978127 RepID=UPI0021B472C3|nr:gluconokinase [Aquabacterium sp. OR-4]MDT7838321.1 gluconokinase [Aquabacterium sp. OR-4]